MNLKKITSGALAMAMVASLAACGSSNAPAEKPAETPAAPSTPAVTTPAAPAAPVDDPNRPAAVTAEDWEAMKAEPVFGKEINYLFNGGACVSAKYQAEALGYYEEYGINAKFLKGGSVVTTVGTGQAMWGTDHIATMLVPVAKGVNMTFVCGAHTGCKSLYTLNETGIKTVEDLRGKRIAIHDGLGESDMNIAYRLLDEFGIDPTTEIEWVVIEGSSTSTQAMMNGEVDAAVYSDYYVAANDFADKMTNIVSLTFTKEFQDEPCCVTAMNNDFIKENPVHAKYVVKAIKRAGEYARLHADEAVQMMFDNDMMTGEFSNQKTFWDTLYFGLSDAFTKRALEEIIADYLRLGMFPADITTDNAEELLNLAWTEVCPDSEMPEGYTVGDPVVPANATVPQKQYSVNGPESPVAPAGYVAPTFTNAMDSEGGDTAVASEHLNSWEASTSGQWDKMFVPVEIEGRAIEYADFDLTPTAEEKAAMEKEPAYGQPVQYWMSDGCTSGPTIADKLGYYAEAGLTAEGSKGGDTYTIALGTNKNHVAVGHIATMLVPCTNDVDLTFVGGAHIGCKSIYVLADSNYNTTADLKGTQVAVPNGIGASDYNITALLLDADGINPQTDVTLMQVSTDACVAAMENGEISGALLSDTFAYNMVKEGKLKCIRSLLDEDFADNNCCVIAMSGVYVRENPVHAKKIVQAVQKAHSYMRENPEEATQMLIDLNMNSENFEMNVMLNNSLQFGLEEDFTEKTLRETVENYVRLGLITAMDDVEAIMAKAWTPVLNK